MADYLNNKELYDEFKTWLTENPDGSNMPDTIGEAILLVSSNMMNHWRFIKYTDDWKEVMVDAAVMACVKYVKSFKYWEYYNPHAYLSMICYRASKDMIRPLKRRQQNKVQMIVDQLEEIKLDDRFMDVDTDILNDMHEKVAVANSNVETAATIEEQVADWMEERDGVFELEVELDETDRL